MEVELQDVLADKRELSNPYDSLKTELDCMTLNFDCCEEEKKRLEDSFQYCNKECNSIKVELDLVKRLMENLALTDNTETQYYHASCIPDTTSFGQIMGDVHSGPASRESTYITGFNPRNLEDNDNPQSASFSSNLAQKGADVENCSQNGIANSVRIKTLRGNSDFKIVRVIILSSNCGCRYCARSHMDDCFITIS